MKKIIYIVFIIILSCIFFLLPDNINNKKSVVKGIYISYIDYGILKDKTTTSMQEDIDRMIANISSFNLNTIILQVRPFADAVYNSKIFPISSCISTTNTLELDILSYFIEKSHAANIDVYAWINPYRISNINKNIPLNAVYSKWIDTDNIEATSSGVYFNPASKEVLNLIIDGVKEIVENYDVDGILYDDYFYPNNTIDLNSYSLYKANGGLLSIENFRISKIIDLLKKTYDTIKQTKGDVLFGIAPAGNIENNLSEEYLDIASILKSKNMLDFVSPQLYYGFNNQNKPYINTLNTWNDMISYKIDLIPSLALYKTGLEDNYAGSGSFEWIYNNDIIKRQIMAAMMESNYNGFILYRYDYLFNSNKMNEASINEKNNIREIIK